MREGRKKKVKCATGVRDGRKKAKSGQDRAGLKELFENSSEEKEFSGFSNEEVEKVMVSLYSVFYASYTFLRVMSADVF